MKETTEYRIVKQLTSKENRARVKLTIIGAIIGATALYSLMFVFMYLLMWFNDKVEGWL